MDYDPADDGPVPVELLGPRRVSQRLLAASGHDGRVAVGDDADENAFARALIPGYPAWVWTYDEGRRDDAKQRTAYAKYWREALRLDQSEIIDEMRALAKELGVMLMGGVAEKEGASIYCTLLTISGEGEVLGRHRKMKPSWYERLVWADGDGKGLKTHPIKGARGGLNCWENWLPLARAALHLQGEIIHVAVWPGNLYSTKDITMFIALEGRSWVISTSGFRPTDYAHLDIDEFPFKEMIPSFARASFIARDGTEARWQ